MNVGSSCYLRKEFEIVGVTADWYQDAPPVTPLILDEKQPLGKGQFSQVVKVTCQDREWAVKKPLAEVEAPLIVKEAALLKYLNEQERKEKQEHIVQVIALITLQNNRMLVMKLYKGGDLHSRVARMAQGLCLASSLKIMEQLLRALSFLKEHGIIHRDIKLPNIFIEHDDVVKLGDFGFAMREGDKEASFMLCGTPFSMSPELLSAFNSAGGSPYGSASDVWATGCAMFKAFSGCALFEDEPLKRWVSGAQQKNLPNKLGTLLRRVSLRKASSNSNNLLLFNKVLTKMLELDPAKRLTPEEGIVLLTGEEPFELIEREESLLEDTQEERESFEVIQKVDFEYPELPSVPEYSELPSVPEGNDKPAKVWSNIFRFVAAGISKLKR